MSPTITIAFAGDVMLGRLVDQAISQMGYDHPWGDLLPALQEADLFLINLETTLTSQTRPADPGKAFNFRAEPTAAEALNIGGVDFASVSNNHILDFGAAGLQDTLAVLEGAGIAHAGAGPDLVSAQRHVILTADGSCAG